MNVALSGGLEHGGKDREGEQQKPPGSLNSMWEWFLPSLGEGSVLGTLGVGVWTKATPRTGVGVTLATQCYNNNDKSGFKFIFLH